MPIPEMVGDWIFDRSRGLGGGGGGDCFLCCDANVLRVVADTIPKISAAGSNRLLDVGAGVLTLDSVKRAPTDIFAVIKFAKNPDERFRREIHALANLRHDNLIRIFDHDKEKQAWYVMELHRDGDLTGPLVRARYRRQAAAVLKKALGVAKALGELHANDVIHRDVKAKNILVGSDGRWILTDLGVALLLSDERLTVGSQPFSDKWRPDWVVDESDQTPKMDVHMLAKLIHYMVSGSASPMPDSQIESERFDLRRIVGGRDGEILHTLIRNNLAHDSRLIHARNGFEFAAQIETALRDIEQPQTERLIFSFVHDYSTGYIPVERNKAHALSNILVIISPRDERLVMRARIVGPIRGMRLRLLLHKKGVAAPVAGTPGIVIYDYDKESIFGWTQPVTVQLNRQEGPHRAEVAIDIPEDDAPRGLAISGLTIAAT